MNTPPTMPQRLIKNNPNAETAFNYFKFLKLVPHVFVDNTETGHERDY